MDEDQINAQVKEIIDQIESTVGGRLSSAQRVWLQGRLERFASDIVTPKE